MDESGTKVQYLVQSHWNSNNTATTGCVGLCAERTHNPVLVSLSKCVLNLQASHTVNPAGGEWFHKNAFSPLSSVGVRFVLFPKGAFA